MVLLGVKKRLLEQEYEQRLLHGEKVELYSANKQQARRFYGKIKPNKQYRARIRYQLRETFRRWKGAIQRLSQILWLWQIQRRKIELSNLITFSSNLDVLIEELHPPRDANARTGIPTCIIKETIACKTLKMGVVGSRKRVPH